MRKRSPLPPQLAGSRFLVGTALGAGVSERRLRGGDLDRSVWGTRGPHGDESFEARCARFALRLPSDHFFSHATAARLHGIPLPLHVERRDLLDISVIAPQRAPHARGIRGHALTLAPERIRTRSGLRLTDAARTWCDLATALTLRQLVAAGDHVLNWRLPLASRAELESESREFVGRRGMSVIRAALPLLSDRAESPPESELRVILQLGGLPLPDVNYVVVNTETGRNLRLDLSFSAYKVVLEYQGDYHRSREQWRSDMTRRSRLEAQGWYVMEINADDLRDPHELVARVRTVLRRRGMR